MQGQQARILIIDNDIRSVNKLQPVLEARGYSVSSIGHSQSLDDDNKLTWNDWILDFAKKFRPHIVIVDLRLRNDYMEEESGLLIIPQLDSVFNILYSARLTHDVVERAKEQSVFRCVAKGAGGTNKVLDALKEAATQASVDHASISIQWPLKWNGESVVCSMFGPDSDVPTNMPDDLVLQLYKVAADEAKISDVTGQMLSQPPASRSRSAVVRVQPVEREPSILKLAPAKRITREQQNYDEHVDEKMRGSFHTRMVASTVFWDMGGLIYSLISGQNIVSFAEHYINCDDADDIVKPLKHLFEEVWRSHYDRKPEVLKDSDFDTLYDLYDDMYDFDKTCKVLCKFDLTNWMEDSTALHPVEWVWANRTASQYPAARLAITHGDLHSENIFVDGEHAWLIDFERTGPGHILRDFVELEIDILTRLASSKIDHGSFIKICKVLLVSSSFNMQRESISLPYDIAEAAKSEAKKCLDVICELRMIAHNLGLWSNVGEYQWALLLNVLFVAHHFDTAHLPNPHLALTQERVLQQRRAFIFAKLICVHLESESS